MYFHVKYMAYGDTKKKLEKTMDELYYVYSYSMTTYTINSHL